MTKRLIVAAGIGLCILAACNKKLEEYNPSGSTIDALYNTPEGFEAAVNGIYTFNRPLYGKEEGISILEAGTDIWTAGANAGSKIVAGINSTAPLTTYNGLISDNNALNANLWIPFYQGINACNHALKYIEEAGLSAERQQVLAGEIHFMRAWFYYHLVEVFGPIPTPTEPMDGIETTASRTPVDQVYELIFADLREAMSRLQPTTNGYGRATLPIAEAFYARVSLTRGNWQEASNYARKVIRDYNFSLQQKYSDLWDISKEKNTEVIWGLNYASTYTLNGGTGNEGHMLYLMTYNDLPGMELDVANGLPRTVWMPTLFLLNLFNEDDARYDASFKQAWIANNAATIPEWTAADAAQNPALSTLVGKKKFAVGDTAVLVTKEAIPDFDKHYTERYRYQVYDINDMYNTATGVPKDRFHYISLNKFADPTRASANENNSGRDVFLIRLAEMYMIAGEAQFRMNNIDSATYFINTVRRRAAQPGRESAMEVQASDITLDFILDERAREFAGEQLRWIDLKRTNTLLSRVKAHNPDAAGYIRDFSVLRPIPLAQLNAVTNKGEFTQNDGY
jgi:SusD family.